VKGVASPAVVEGLIGTTGLDQSGLAVDASGDVFVTDWENDRVWELEPGNSQAQLLPFAGLDGPSGVALDSAGNVYVTNMNDGELSELVQNSVSPPPQLAVTSRAIVLVPIGTVILGVAVVRNRRRIEGAADGKRQGRNEAVDPS